MSRNDHRIERRATLLSTRIHERIAAVTAGISPPGERRPFTVQHSRNEALAWWQENFYTPIGSKVLEAWKPEQIAELQVALSEYNAQQMPSATNQDGFGGGLSGES